MKDNDITVTDVLAALHLGRFSHDELEQINKGLSAAWRMDRADRLEKAQSALKIGDFVVIHGVRPRTLDGVQGKVGRFNSIDTRADIEITDGGWTGRWTKGQHVSGIPLVCLTKVEQTNDTRPKAKAPRRGK
jgi:hypothetical protein